MLNRIIVQHLDRDVVLGPRVAGAIDVPHAALAEQGDDLVAAEALAGSEWHGL